MAATISQNSTIPTLFRQMLYFLEHTLNYLDTFLVVWAHFPDGTHEQNSSNQIVLGGMAMISVDFNWMYGSIIYLNNSVDNRDMVPQCAKRHHATKIFAPLVPL